MPIPLILFGAGFVASHLLSSSDDHVAFEVPFLVRVATNDYSDKGVVKGEYIAITAYVCNTSRKELKGFQRNGRFEITVKSKHVIDVGDIGRNEWLPQVLCSKP